MYTNTPGDTQKTPKTKPQNSLFASSFFPYKLALSVHTYVWLVLVKMTVLFFFLNQRKNKQKKKNTSHICFPALFLSDTSVRQHCSVKINTDSFNHCHNNYSGFLAFFSRVKKCPLSIRINLLITSLSHNLIGLMPQVSSAPVFLRDGMDRSWRWTKKQPWVRSHCFCCSLAHIHIRTLTQYTYIRAHIHLCTALLQCSLVSAASLKIIWRFAVGGGEGTRSMTGPTPFGPRSCFA